MAIMLNPGSQEPRDLFRREAIEGRRRRLSGDVIIDSPLVTLPATIAIAIVVAAAFLVSLLVPFTREYRVSGWIVPEGGVVEVVSPASGTVSALYAVEGARVRAGDRILVLNTDSRLEQGNSVQEAMISASRGTADLIGSRQRTLVTAHGGSVRAHRQRLQDLVRERLQFTRVMDLKRQNAQAKAGQVLRYGQLVERGFGSGLELQRRQSESLAAQQDVIEGEIRLSTLDREIGDLENQMTREDSDFALAINEIRQQRVGVSSQLVEAAARRGVSITAPSSGVISRLSVRAGQAVVGSSHLFSIVPTGRLEVRLLAPARGSGLPAPGARARILVDAFPYSRHGALTGYVKSVARSTTLPDATSEAIDVRVPYFIIVVALDAQQGSAVSRADLRPGMTVSGRLELDRRSLLSWLLPGI